MNARECLNRPSAWLLIAVNALPLAGVLLYGWSVFDLVFLYWAENVVLGIINVFRMITCQPSGATGSASFDRLRKIGHHGSKLFFIPFFVVHYGMFCWAHGTFVAELLSNQSLDDILFGPDRWEVLAPSLIWALALLAASHLFSYFRNFLLGGEFRHTNAATLMMRPYGRIVVMHIVILFGAFGIQALGSPVPMLLLLIIGKTILDLWLHNKERVILAADNNTARSAYTS